MIDALRRNETNKNDKTQDRDNFLNQQFWRMMTGTYPGHDIGSYPLVYYIQVLMQHPKEIRDKFHIEEIVNWVIGKTNG